MSNGDDRTVQRTVETSPDGATKETKTYEQRAGGGSGHSTGEKALAVAKHPTTGMTVIIGTLIATLQLQPGLLPYAQAGHEHDIEAVKTVIVETVSDSVQTATLRSEIRRETVQIGTYDAQILSGRCIPAMATAANPNPMQCVLEKAFREQAKDRKASYQRELDSLH